MLSLFMAIAVLGSLKGRGRWISSCIGILHVSWRWSRPPSMVDGRAVCQEDDDLKAYLSEGLLPSSAGTWSGWPL